MITQVEMKRDLFGYEIKQQSKTEYLSLTDLSKAANEMRRVKGLSVFNVSLWLKSKSTIEFINELKNKYPDEDVITKSKGRNSQTWVHPLLFIDCALAVNPKLKVEVYDWMFDSLLANRNDSGDSYKEMSAALFTRFNDVRKFNSFIINTANYIKTQLNVLNWETATEEQLKKRHDMHVAIKLYCKVLTDPREAIRLGIKEVL